MARKIQHNPPGQIAFQKNEARNKPPHAKKKVKGKKNGRPIEVCEPKAQLARNRHINKHFNLPPAKIVRQRKVQQKYNQGLPVVERKKFKTIQKLGKGTFGQVYLVEDEAHKRFALKQVGNNKDLRHECAAMLQLSRHGYHEHLINVVAVSPGNSSQKYMVMELGGSDLRKALAKDYMSGNRLRDSFLQILKGASSIEQAGLQHNDLKPENILINEKGCLKICDFGLTKKKNIPSTAGTKWYMPPEKLGVIRSSRADKADSWALGCIFAEMALDQPVMDELMSKGSPKPSAEAIKKQCADVYNRILECEGTAAADLFDKLTAFDPNERISPTNALKSPYFKDPNGRISPTAALGLPYFNSRWLS